MSTKFGAQRINAGNVKHKKHSEHWLTKKEPAMWPRQTSNICAIKNKNTQRDCTKSTDEMKYIFKNQIGR